MLQNTDNNLPWILHCGESLLAKNFIFVDGLLLNTQWFGHCINLFKLGNLYEKIRNKKIVLEINPISNQTLRQVRDLRLHPFIGIIILELNVVLITMIQLYIIQKKIIMIILWVWKEWNLIFWI